MATYTINIEFTFPLDENGNVDIHGTPTIENDPAQRDDVPGTDDEITWTVSATNSTNLDGLQIEGIQFYSDQRKTLPTTPSCLNAGDRDTEDGSFTMTFKDMTFPDTVFYYDVLWQDDDVRTNQVFDPTLEIKPRIKHGGGEQAAHG